ncbi:MAG: VIT1/CCC1 transporter family protein [Spirochaetia bacterium]
MTEQTRVQEERWKTLPQKIRKQIINTQKNELTEYRIYTSLAEKAKDAENAQVLRQIGEDEKRHADFWEKTTGIQVKPKSLKVFFYVLVSRIFGITFGIKLMELGEENAQFNYKQLAEYVPGAREIENDEEAHEEKLISMIQEEGLLYVGSVVLGLNDALVELTGTLAGLTLALQNTRLIAIAGLITGIAASMSMAASEYLSTKSENNSKNAVKAAVYTGTAYIGTVVILILPYFIGIHYIASLVMTLVFALLIIFIFNFYISVAKGYKFLHRFGEMALLSMGVALLSFIIGYFIRSVIGVDA